MSKMKEWIKEKWTKTKEFCVLHPDSVLTVIGGVLTIVGGALEIYGNKTEYKDNLFTEVDGTVYKIPSKQMKTCNKVKKDK